MFFIKEIPKSERPRERLIIKGVEALSNVELIALLLRSGSKTKSVIELAKEVYYQLETLGNFKKVSLNELIKISGIKIAKATIILAAIELGKRINLNEYDMESKSVLSAYDVYQVMKETSDYEQEHFFCILLDTKMNIIKKELIYIGTVDQMIIHPREVFKNAIKYNAKSIILVHNHPSGDCKPSNADIITTKRLEEVSKVIDIELLDHIIIGKNKFYSYKEKQTFKG